MTAFRNTSGDALAREKYVMRKGPMNLWLQTSSFENHYEIEETGLSNLLAYYEISLTEPPVFSIVSPIGI